MKTSYYQSTKLDPKKHLVVQTSIGNPRFGKQPEWETEHITPIQEVFALADKGRAVYTKAYVKQLEGIGVEAIRAELQELRNAAGQRDVVLCCFCGPKKEFCHRHIFAWWWHTKTGEHIEEL